jgi:hypothetical protein
MQSKASNQVGLEDEILKKVEERFDELKHIIDEQKDHAQTIIKNLESVQNYRPPPSNFTTETIQDLSNFKNDLDQTINTFKTASNPLDVLRQRNLVSVYQ